MTDILLSGGQVHQLAGHGTGVLRYPELEMYDSIEDIFHMYPNGIILLYIQSSTPKAITGHWTALNPIYDEDDDLNGVEFFCSYGTRPDFALDWIDDATAERLDVDTPHLAKLLLDFYDRDYNVYFNEVDFQDRSRDIATCGRWAGVRLHYGKIPLKKFQKLFLKYRKKLIDLDKLITMLTDKMLKL
jgi:hypothetical protein